MKKCIAILCLAAMLLSLAACGAAPAPETQAPTQAPTTAATEAVTEAADEAPTEAVPAVVPRLGAMTGPTGIGMVKLFADGEQAGTYTHTITGAADELTPLILQGQLDIVSVPSNLASVLYNKTQGQVKALAVNVLGVLYVCQYGTKDIQKVSDLKGKTIYATGKGSVPEYFLRYILTENGLNPDTDVTLDFKSEPAEVVAGLNAAGEGIAMLPQPYVIAAKGQLGENFNIVLSVSDEWEALNNGTLCTTACILVRSEFAQEHPEAVAQFMSDFATSAAWVNENVADAAALCGQYDIVKAPVAEKAIPQCNIVCITGNEMKSAMGGCLDVIFQQNPAAVGGSLPGADFYYGAE